MRPATRFVNERNVIHATSAINEDRHWDAISILPVWIDAGAVAGWRCETAVWMRRWASASWRPVAAIPVDEMRGRLLGHSFPPNIAVVCQCDVCEDRAPGA